MTDSTGTTANTYDQRNELTQESLPGPKTNTYGYDPAGNLTVFTDAGGTVIYGYDAADRLTSLKEPNQSVTSFGYDANDNRSSTSYPNGVTQSYGYDASERLSSIGATKGQTTLTSFSYSYNQGGSDRELRQSVTDNLAGQTTSYSYDTIDRLTRANSQSANYQYAYDVNGNMCAKNTGAYISGFNCGSSGSGVTSFSYNTANELSGSGYSFDGAGNETASPSFSSLVYNGKNQTASITPSGGSALNLTYSGIGQALRTATGGTSYVNSSLGLSAETTGSNSTYYTREPGGALTEERLPVGNYYYLSDGLGSIVALTDSAGAVVNTYKYEPYGNVSSSTGSVANPWKFAGYYFDSSTGLYKVGERYYATGAGRWLQRDSIDSPLDASGWNRYLYAGDNPVNFTDPTGAYCSKREFEHWLVDGTPGSDCNHLYRDYMSCTKKASRRGINDDTRLNGCWVYAAAKYSARYGHSPLRPAQSYSSDLRWARRAFRVGMFSFHVVRCIYRLAKTGGADATACNQF